MDRRPLLRLSANQHLTRRLDLLLWRRFGQGSLLRAARRGSIPLLGNLLAALGLASTR